MVSLLPNSDLTAHPLKDKCWLERKDCFVLEAGNLERRRTSRTYFKGERGR